MTELGVAGNFSIVKEIGSEGIRTYYLKGKIYVKSETDRLCDPKESAIYVPIREETYLKLEKQMTESKSSQGVIEGKLEISIKNSCIN